MTRWEQQHRKRQHEEDEPAPPTPTSEAAQARAAEVDSLLGEIDSVLESNAEEFVRGFVQKGGQ